MSDALWGVIVGGGVTLAATWLQQHYSKAREESAFAREAEDRRRATEAEAIRELRDLMASAAADLDTAVVCFAADAMAEGNDALARFGAIYVRVIGLVHGVRDEEVRRSALEAVGMMVDVMGAVRRGADDLAELKSQSKQAYIEAQALAGERLRALT